MAITNREHVGQALELLQKGLKPFVARQMNAAHQGNWHRRAQQSVNYELPQKDGKPEYDVAALLAIMWNEWNEAFTSVLGRSERSIISELREVRNGWAHQEPFSTDDAYRALDSIERLLKASGASNEAHEVENARKQLMRERFRSEARAVTKRKPVTPTQEGVAAPGGLTPWRHIITPHPDVASGGYIEAEFAADLGQVHRKEARAEYQDPTEFFGRTYLTAGLKYLLTEAMKRVTGQGGSPIVKLQTNFGGGKTHSLLALMHLFSGCQPGELPGIEQLMADAGISELPKVNTAVIVAQDIAVAEPHRKPDGTVVHTLWGEIAWQLGGADAYEFVRASDEAGTSPGATLRDVLQLCAPCMILIDEWVAYARQLYGKDDLPAGTFDAHFTFAQALTEHVRAVPGAVLVATIPASDIEKGGEAGVQATIRLENLFGRMESPWRPASTQEGFEIVRRRLFEPIADPQKFAMRDAVIKAFTATYKSHAQDVPTECLEPTYGSRMESAYPIHPELFERLYSDWAALEKFQMTRGVLRLMAAVIHSLWESQDSSLMIMPSSIPIDDDHVKLELTRNMEQNWGPVIETDVDGLRSLPRKLDSENGTFGRYSACRKVARTLYLGSAPRLNNENNKGIGDARVKLGCFQPGESPATFGDALRRLANEATYVYIEGQRYWYSPVPNVNRVAKDIAAEYEQEEVWEKIREKLRAEQNSRGDFTGVHACPASSGDVPDERSARLVIIDPRYAHSKSDDNEALKAATTILQQRGNSPRIYRNTLVFLVAESARLKDLEMSMRSWMAWQRIYDEREIRNLDAHQSNLAKTRRDDESKTIDLQLLETYRTTLVPTQPNPTGGLEWQTIPLQGDGPLAVRASRKLITSDLLVTDFAGTPLRHQLDRIPLWNSNHVELKQLAEHFAQYLYLPRLRSSALLVKAVEDGLNNLMWETETFAYADGYDEAQQRYLALSAGGPRSLSAEPTGLVVKPEVAAAQFEADKPAIANAAQTSTGLTGSATDDSSDDARTSTTTLMEPPSKKMCRFHASKHVDAVRFGRDAEQIGKEVIQHLAALAGADVQITLEIRAAYANGFDDAQMRTISENCNVLRFDHSEFEEE